MVVAVLLVVGLNGRGEGTCRLTCSGGTHTVFLGLITEATPGGFVGDVAHVSAYGEGYRNISNGHPVDASDVRGAATELTVNLGSWALRLPFTEVEVRCFDYEGVLQDHLFTFGYAANASLLGAAPSGVAHAFAGDGVSVVPRLGEPAHQYNGGPAAWRDWPQRYSDRGGLWEQRALPVGFLLRPEDGVSLYTAATWAFCTMPGGLETDSAFITEVRGR